MDFLTIDKLLLITVFFVPGFIYLKSYRLFIAEVRTDFSKDLYEAIGVSFINAIIFSYPIYKINTADFIRNYSFWYFLCMFLIIIVFPFLWVVFYYKISKCKWFSKYLITPTKSTWDSFFMMRYDYWVIISLKNGGKIAGKYGKSSISSTYPMKEEIYIEDLWTLDEEGDFSESIPNNCGVLITADEISLINFYKFKIE